MLEMKYGIEQITKYINNLSVSTTLLKEKMQDKPRYIDKLLTNKNFFSNLILFWNSCKKNIIKTKKAMK